LVDTEIGGFIYWRPSIQRRKFAREFKLEAVRLVRERGVMVAQVARDLDVHENVLRKWVKEFAADPGHTFGDYGQMRPEQLEIDRLRREVAKLKAERDILKKCRVTIAKDSICGSCHREAQRDQAGGVDVRDVRCFAKRLSCLAQWAPSQRARDGEVIGARVRTSRIISYRTYGARRAWHDLLAEGIERRDDCPARHRRGDHGDLAGAQTRCPAAPLGPGQPIYK
jgi:transposase-like protein